MRVVCLLRLGGDECGGERSLGLFLGRDADVVEVEGRGVGCEEEGLRAEDVEEGGLVDLAGRSGRGCLLACAVVRTC